MATTKLTGTLIRSGSIPTTALGGGVVSSSLQITSVLPSGTVSSSAQVKPLLPDGTVSSSNQVQLNGITGTTFANSDFTFPQALTVGGTLTAERIHTEYVTSSIIYESGSTKFGDTADDTHQFTGSLSVLGTISGALILPSGVVTASSQIDITATTNYTTFSSSLSTIDRNQTARIDSLESVTSSYAINSNIQSQLFGVVSSSTQIQPLLPAGTISSSTQINVILDLDNVVSSSAQIDITATTNYSTFSSSIATKNDLQDVSINALNAATSSYALQSQLAGVASSSTQVKAYLPDGTVSSSAQLPAGTVSSSAQYPGWVTASNQIALSGISGNTFSTGDFTFPSSNLKVTGSLTVLGDISGALLLPAGIVTASSQIVWSSVNYNTDIVSSSTQVKPLLPDGVISSSAQYPGWVTASSQVDVRNTTGIATIATTGSNTFRATQTIIGNVFLSSSFPLVYNNSATNNMLFGLFDGIDIYGAYYQTFGNNYSELNQRGGAEFVYDTRNNSGANFHIASFNGATWTEKFRVDDNGAHVTGSLKSSGGITGSLLGTASFATTASFALATAGTVENANTASYVAYTNIDGKPTLVSASAQISITATDGYSTFSSSIATKNDIQDVSIGALNAATSSYAINSTIQSQLAGVVSSSAQVKPLLPGGTVSSSAQYPGWVTASSQIQLNAITGTTFSNAAFLFPQDLTLGGDLIVGGNDIRNNLGDDVITFRGTNNLDVRITSGSLDVWNGEIRNSGTTAIQMNGQNVVISGRLNLNGDEIRSSLNQIALTLSNNNISTPGSASATGGFVGSLTGSILSPGVVSSSAQYPGWVTSSAQIDYNSITNKLSGVYSSSAFTSPNQGTARLTLNGVQLTDVDLGVQTTDTPTFAGVSSSNHITPTADNTYNLGSPEKRWANIYTGDLVLSNEGSSGNTVDGTTGNWTIQEGEEHLYIINNKSGKKFRFMLSEIN